MEQTIQFLNHLDSKAQNFLFACYDYRKVQKGKQIYGSFESCKQKLKANNNDVFCVYVTINQTDGANRKKENITKCRAIWIEDDTELDSPRTDFPLSPSLIVQSSAKKYHYYWFTSTKRFDEWNAVMQTMVNKWGCDKNARDISRVMRLPGFIHKKDLNSPFECKIHSGDGQFYSWFGLKAVFKPAELPKETAKDEPKAESDYSEEKAIKDLLTSTNYHGSLTSISMSLTNRGVSRELQYYALSGLMNKIPLEKRRPEFDARVSAEHLYECIDTAIRKRNEEMKNQEVRDLPDNFDPEWKMNHKQIEFPPGLLGQMCQEIYEMAPYPNKEIAIAAAFGLIAGITGRAFNVLGMGLNLYIAILADSGIGKAILKDSINLALRGSGGKFNTGSSFIGKTRFTGPKPIFDMLSKGMSRICVLEEAGLMSESKAGDQTGITRVFLDLFTSSGLGKWAGDEGYSAAENSIPSLHSPALSIVNVSTPKSFLSALRNKSADVSGEVARLWMMRSMGEKPYLNENRREDFSTEVIKRLGLLLKEAVQFQDPDMELKPREINVPKKYFNDANIWVDRENAFFRDGDVLRRTLSSRAFAKVVKISAIASLFNGSETITDPEYKWVEKQVLSELNSINDSFTHESSDDLNSLTKTASIYIFKIIKGKYKDSKKKVSEEMGKAGLFSHYTITQAVKNCAQINALDDDTSKPFPKKGIDKVLIHMTNIGYIIKVSDKEAAKYGKSKVVYRITDDFARFMKDE